MKPIDDVLALVSKHGVVWVLLAVAPLLQANVHEFELGYQYQTFTHQQTAFLPSKATQSDGFLGYQGQVSTDSLSLNMDASLYLDAFFSADALFSADAIASKNTLEANQLYLAADMSDAVSISLGRQYLAWDYGYGWRLFDVFGRKGREDTRSGAAQGADLVQWQYWGPSSALDLLCAWDSEPFNSQSSTSMDTSLCGARWYGASDLMDWQALALTGANQDSLGVSSNGLVNDATSVFMSVLTDGSSERIQQGEVGIHWTHSSGVELTFAAVYDAAAATSQHWQDVLQANRLLSSQVSNQASHQTVNQAASGGGLTQQQAEIVTLLQAQRLTRYQALVRLSYLQNDWDNSLAWVSLPSGLGHIFDTQIGYQWSDSVQLSLAWQHFVSEAGLFGRHSSAVSIMDVLPSRDVVSMRLVWPF